ncbi:MAG: alpha-amylase/4-alpha-glucanotransferase domain-containing protein, partial [Pseudomonadota bacterium]
LDAWQNTRPGAEAQELVAQARRELYKGQCNCPYWHGLFGGIYLNYLRHAVYEHLIRAEKIIAASCHGAEPWIDYRLADFKRDLSLDILISGKNLNVYFSPRDGGGLFELDFKPCSFNLSNIFTRKMEGYHRKLKIANGFPGSHHENEQPVSIHSISKVKEEGLQSHLIYDWYQRFSFIDHFLGESTTLEAFATSRYTEIGDFINAPYVLQKIEKDPEAPAVYFSLSRSGCVLEDRSQFPVAIEKSFCVNDSLMEIGSAYCVKNKSDRNLMVWFGVEFNITLIAGNDPLRYYVFPGDPKLKLLMNATEAISRVAAFDIKDAWNGFGLQLSMTPGADVWTFPIQTVSQSEDGLEKTYQGSTVLVHWKMPLVRNKEQKRAIKLRLYTFPGEKEKKE